jgi:hypothetical protein
MKFLSVLLLTFSINSFASVTEGFSNVTAGTTGVFSPTALLMYHSVCTKLPSNDPNGGDPSNECTNGAVTAQLSAWGLTTLALLLKVENVQPLLERAEGEGEISPELRSLLLSVKDVFEAEGLKISEDEILRVLYNQ